MSTFAVLARKVQLKADKGNMNYELVLAFLRDAENDFIERTHCTEKISTIDTDGDYTYAIASATIATKTFTFSSTTDLTELFAAGLTFTIEDSTGNDGSYTVVSSSFATPVMSVVVSETVADATADGNMVIDPQPYYDLPSDFEKAFRIEWDGVQLEPLPQGLPIQLHQSDGVTEYTGTPYRYWIIEGQIRLLNAPSSHGILKIWHSYRNTSAVVASPIIPSIEHDNLVHFAIASIMEFMEQEQRAVYYWNKYYEHVDSSKYRYISQRFDQDQIVSVNTDMWDDDIETHEYSSVSE